MSVGCPTQSETQHKGIKELPINESGRKMKNTTSRCGTVSKSGGSLSKTHHSRNTMERGEKQKGTSKQDPWWKESLPLLYIPFYKERG